jgi:hypothetical protein
VWEELSGDIGQWARRREHCRRKAQRETYPQAEIYTYHDAGHAPMFSRFSEYLTMVTKFLDLNPAPLS